ncbi:TonB-dependent receptor [Oxalicibacterium solurbis]|uniref:TonB-dependent receptor n=1 Tax=Oxalicibacterium solurbis TaxID=69280 RepID=A0A8J3AVF0_9BURK|nr:TonB-dependent receptor [Oxalicibacterium solurbis]
MFSIAAIHTIPAAAQADPDQTLPQVTVSASRFESDAAPIGATVITAGQIREAGINNVNEAIRKIGGVFGRQNYSGTSDYSLDLRGFGTNSEQNIAIFVDGIRISENELQPAMLSSIPVESVERIEIVRGGSSVLYGDGATGGTIQIITKRGATQGTHGSVVAAVGNRGQEELRASLNKGWDGFSFDANLGSLRTDNYRDNNELRQDNFSGGLQWASADTRVGFRVEAAREDFGLPGSLTYDEYRDDPRQTNTPYDKGTLDSDRYTLYGEKKLGQLQLAADLSYREKTSTSSYTYGTAPASRSRMESTVTQFSPRLRYTSAFSGVTNEFVAGMDFQNADRKTKSDYSNADGSQESIALYLRDEVRFSKARIAFGVRHERFDQDFSDPLSFSFSEYDRSFSLNAWDLQGSYDLTSIINLFAKVGRSYRVANIDEYTFSPNNEPLTPQRSNDAELGASFGNKDHKLTARVFRHDLRDEIFYDPTIPNVNGFGGLGANVNLDPTRRQGLEIEASTRITSDVTMSAVLQHVSAKFRSGPNDGKEMVLVPKNIATFRMNWLPGNGQSADVGLQWVDSQRYGSDFTNTCSARIPSFVTLDARYAKRIGAWELAVSGTNLTDRDYFTQAFGCRSSIYPDPGRTVRFTARMDF